jgi:hypothetical protein
MLQWDDYKGKKLKQNVWDLQSQESVNLLNIQK